MWNQVQHDIPVLSLFICFFFIHFQQKIIELKVKEYKELAQHAQSEMEKLVWSISYMYIFDFFNSNHLYINCKYSRLRVAVAARIYIPTFLFTFLNEHLVTM